MPTFLTGLLLAALSGGGTYWYTGDGTLSALVAALVALATWCGVALLVVIDD